MKKKITFTMVLCIAICAVAGCSGSSNNVESTTTTAAETTITTTTTAATEAETTTATAETKEEAPAVEGTVIYDANDIMITATEFTTCKEYDNKPCLALDIINNTGKELFMYQQPASVGGWMEKPDCLTVSEDGYLNLDGTFTIPAGNDTNKYFIFVGNSLLEKYGFTEIPDIELGFEIFAGESEEPFMTELVDVVNPDYSGGIPETDESGDVVYDKDDVKIIMQGETYDLDRFGPIINLYASNSTDKTVFIRIPETILDGTEFETLDDMVIAPGKRKSLEVMFYSIEDAEMTSGISMKDSEPASEITMRFDIYEYDQRSDNVLIDSSEPVTVTYDASTVEKTHIFSENLWEEKQLSEEELAERKGWWTHEGEFTDNDSLTVAVDFLPLGVYTWHVSGSFGEDFYWSGNVRITDDGLYGTMQTVTYNADESYTHGKPVKVKLTEDGDSGILLTYGTGEEYHLVPAAE